MATLKTGYNPSKIQELMYEIRDTYDKIGTRVYDGWQQVWPVMHQEWVGADEQSLEEAFVKKMCQMYSSSAGVINALLTNLRGAGESWNTFQQNNIMEGAQAHASSYNVETVQVTVNDAIIVFQSMEITDAMERGLLNGSASGEKIKTNLDTYMADIKQEIQSLYDGIDATNAFLGETQTSSIMEYIEQIGRGVGVVLTAANDIYEAIDTQISANYTQSEENVSTEYNGSKAESEIDAAVGAGMRWHQ